MGQSTSSLLIRDYGHERNVEPLIEYIYRYNALHNFNKIRTKIVQKVENGSDVLKMIHIATIFSSGSIKKTLILKVICP